MELEIGFGLVIGWQEFLAGIIWIELFLVRVGIQILFGTHTNVFGYG